MSTILKQKIIDKLDAVVFSNDTENDNEDKGYQAIVDAISEYVSEDYIITGLFTGIDALVPPVPVAGTSTHNLLTTTTTWKDTYINTVKTGVDVGGTVRMFLAIQTMVTGTVNVSLEMATPVTVLVPPPDPVIASPVIFPAISSFGTPCEIELLATKGDRDASWGIVAKYIQMGLNINVIPPIMFSGTLGSSVTGVATALLSFN